MSSSPINSRPEFYLVSCSLNHSWKSPKSLYQVQYNGSRQERGLKCFSMSVSEVKHTSLLLNTSDIDFHPPFPSPPRHTHTHSLTPSRCPRICLASNSRRLKQLGLLREVNCTQIMFDRERSEEETERDGRRDRCQREKIIAPGREATIRVALSPSVC